MKRYITPFATLFIAALLAAVLPAQSLSITPNPVAAGGTASIDLVNTTSGPLFVLPLGISRLRIVHASGELAWSSPNFYLSDVLWYTQVLPGQSTNVLMLDTMTTPVFPLATGRYFALYTEGSLTSTRSFDVGPAAASAPTIGVVLADGGDHHLASQSLSLTLLNGSQAQATAVNLTWSVTAAGSNTVLASGAAGNLVIPADGQSFVPLLGAPSILGTTFEVSVNWTDPTEGAASRVLVYSGPVVQNIQTADIWFPHGTEVPAGGLIPVTVQSRANPIQSQLGCVFANEPCFNGNPDFALMLSFSPGASPLPTAGVVLPLALDALLQITIARLNAPLLPGSPGSTDPALAFGLLPFIGPVGRAGIIHPGPFASGFTICCAALTADFSMPLNSQWQASMLRRVRFQ